jgi:hypothetical protein
MLHIGDVLTTCIYIFCDGFLNVLCESHKAGHTVTFLFLYFFLHFSLFFSSLLDFVTCGLEPQSLLGSKEL